MTTIDKRFHAPMALGTALLLAALILKPYHLNLGLARWAIIAVSGALGFGLGWLLSPYGAAARRAIVITLLAIASFFVLTDNGPVGWGLTTLFAWGAFAAGMGYWLGTVAKDFFTHMPTTFGSAEWATADYIKDHDLTGSDGLYLGAFPDTDGTLMRVRYTGDRHLLTIAPTRAGKGTTAIIPNLLTYGDEKSGSCLVIDPKGENAIITAAQRRAMGQTVHIVDPWGIASRAGEASRFNPLDWLDANDPDITENAMILADALVVPDANGDKFWVEEAKAVLQGVLLYVATDAREAEHRHLGRVRDLLLLDGEDLGTLFLRMVQSPWHVVASTGARCLQKDEKLLANVMASAQAQTHFLDSERIRASLSASDFKFEDLKTGAVTIYLVLPVDRLNAFGRWLRLLIQQAITVNARNIDVQPKQPILFILDEMPALGRLAAVEQAYRLMAGFGMTLWAIAQDVGQLRELYKDGWEGFAANSAAITYYGSRDKISADFFSDLCGLQTVWNFSSAVARVTGWSKGGASGSSSTTENRSVVQRKLAFPDELMRIPSDRQLVLIGNHHPIMGLKRRWFEDPTLKTLGVDLHRERVA